MTAGILICAAISLGFVEPKQPADISDEIRALGGNVELVESSGPPPATGVRPSPSRISSVTFYKAKLPEGFLPRLAASPELETLTLCNCTLPPDAWPQLGKIDRLQSLEIVGCGITDELAKEFAAMRNLRSLVISCNGLTDAGFVHIGALTGLRRLSISGSLIRNVGITRAGFAQLASLRGLQELEIRYLDLDDDCIGAISTLRDLTTFRVFGTGFNVTDKGMDHLARLASLKSVSISGWAYTDRGLAALRQLRSLEKLSLHDNERVDGSGLAALKSELKLREVSLSSIPVTDQSVKQIADLKQVTILSLNNAPVTDAGMEFVARMASLEFLNVRGTSVSDRGLAHLEFAKNLKAVETDDGTAEYAVIRGTGRLKRTFVTAAAQGRAVPAPAPAAKP